MDRWASMISRVFDPAVVMPLVLVLAVSQAYMNGDSLGYLLFLLLIDVVVPGFVLFYFVSDGKILSGWDVEKRSERVPLFGLVVLTHLVGVGGAFVLDKHPLAEYLAGFWLLSVVYAVATLRFKISVHAGVISALVTFLVLTRSGLYSVAYALVLLVVWARVYGKYHRLVEALAGAGVPVVVLPIVFELLGLR